MDELWKVETNDGDNAILASGGTQMKVSRPPKTHPSQFKKDFREGELKAQSWIDKFYPR